MHCACAVAKQQLNAGFISRMAVVAVLLCLLVAAGSYTAADPSSECAYLGYNFIRGSSRLPSLLPSVSSDCLAAYNRGNPSEYCTSECRSLHSLHSRCTSSQKADVLISYKCGEYQNRNCIALNSLFYSLVHSVYSTCNDTSRCSSACEASIAALEERTGCCSSDVLNGPKAACGQRLVAPCATPLNTPSVPSSECSYFDYYVYSGKYCVRSLNDSLLPSVSHACVEVLEDGGLTSATCIKECRSLYDLIARCYGVQRSHEEASRLCGRFDRRSCSSWLDHFAMADVYGPCSDPGHCSLSCLDAIASVEERGGCCYAPHLNGAKVLCGQQPIQECSTVFTLQSQQSRDREL